MHITVTKSKLNKATFTTQIKLDLLISFFFVLYPFQFRLNAFIVNVILIMYCVGFVVKSKIARRIYFHTSPYHLFASHLTEHFHLAENVWKLVMRLFLGIEPIAVSSSCKKYHVPIVISSSCKIFTYRPSSRSVAK